ncbi:MAG: hypothetical protein U0935_05160 [Pirellulales bacterium]
MNPCPPACPPTLVAASLRTLGPPRPLALLFAGLCGVAVLLYPGRDGRGTEPPSLTGLQRQIRAALRAEATARTLVDRAAATYELCALHREIVGDPRFRSLETLQEMRREVASRLLKIQADCKRASYRQRSAARPGITPDDVLDTLADHLSLAGAVQGGPARLLAEQPWVGRGGAGGGLGPPDNGPALVDLIQRTIHPDFWDVQGGPGTIVYFSPLRCLVVRATDEVQQDVGGLVRGLRAVNP